MKATEKTLTFLVDEVNQHRARAGMCPLFFIKETRNLKLQNRHTYKLYVFPQEGEERVQVLQQIQTANGLRLYLAGLLDGQYIGTKIAAKEVELKLMEEPK